MNNDVDYYNKEITKNNKEITKCNEFPLRSSFGLASLSPSPMGSGAVAQEEILSSGQKDGDLTEGQIETLPDEIKEVNVKRAIVQLWHNPNTSREWKLKVRLNLDFGEGEQPADFICPLNKDWGNYTKYHPEASKIDMIAWAREMRDIVKDSIGVKPYLGKFHESQGWKKKGQRFNTNEPYSAGMAWYDPNEKKWFCYVKIYDWQFTSELTKDGLTVKQQNCRGQKLWMNPQHYQIQRPKTWAQKRKEK
jgi:hypothetical protein